MKRRTFQGESAAIPLLRVGAVVVVFLFAWACSSSPRFQGMTSEQIFEAGVQSFEAGDWDDAREAFDRVLTTDPGFARRAEARLYLARAYFQDEEYILAANEFELFLMRSPTHEAAPEASLGICRSYAELSPIPQRDQEYTRRAERRCRETANEFANHDAGATADSIRRVMTNRLAEKWYLEGRWYQRHVGHPPAILIFEEIIDHFPGTEWAPRAMWRLYRAYEELGWQEEMDEVARRLLFLYPDSEAAQRVSRERADGNG